MSTGIIHRSDFNRHILHVFLNARMLKDNFSVFIVIKLYILFNVFDNKGVIKYIITM